MKGAVLFEVEPNDLRIFAIALVVRTAAGLVASAIPAHRAARVDPLIALRQQWAELTPCAPLHPLHSLHLLHLLHLELGVSCASKEPPIWSADAPFFA